MRHQGQQGLAHAVHHVGGAQLMQALGLVLAGGHEQGRHMQLAIGVLPLFYVGFVVWLIQRPGVHFQVIWAAGQCARAGRCGRPSLPFQSLSDPGPTRFRGGRALRPAGASLILDRYPG